MFERTSVSSRPHVRANLRFERTSGSSEPHVCANLKFERTSCSSEPQVRANPRFAIDPSHTIAFPNRRLHESAPKCSRLHLSVTPVTHRPQLSLIACNRSWTTIYCLRDVKSLNTTHSHKMETTTFSGPIFHTWQARLCVTPDIGGYPHQQSHRW